MRGTLQSERAGEGSIVDIAFDRRRRLVQGPRLQTPSHLLTLCSKLGSTIMSSNSPTSASPPAPAPETTSESVPAEAGSSTNDMPIAERTRHKRPRAAVDPSTPKGEGDDGRTLSNFTPLAKKGRVEGEDDGGSDPERAGSPPPIASTSRPSTPTRIDESTIEQPPATEGKDTKKLRERVAAMKPPGQEGEASNKDVEIADVAAEVSSSAAKLADEQDDKEAKDVEIAEVAAEVGATAQKMGEQDELKQEGPEGSAQANAAAEVADSAAVVQAQDERAADTAKEVAEAAAAVPEPTPAPASAKPSTSVQPSFASYSSTSSPFSAFASSASPLGSVSTPNSAPVEAQKPKAKSAFSAAPFLASNVPLATVPDHAAKPAAETAPAAERAVSPFTKAAPTTNLASASPFSAFASTSGFAAAPKSGSGASAFSAFSTAPSAFSSVPAGGASTEAGSGAQPSVDKSASSAPTSGGEGRKVGEPEEHDATKPVFTEKEHVTGEEEEETLHQVKCKLYAMSEGQWAERGMGPIRLNQTVAKGDKHGARLVMRADATHRLLLNAPLFRGFSIAVSNEKYVLFTAIEGDHPTSYMLRTGNSAAADALVQAVHDKVATL
ncbi:hypothetical protein BMF94_5677 [Rhodotorula taiwanensis]|uniref:RanBD1 domain-containing protein n=1 Tax=Rhodotorula taiwanensis TaxID=741276 RepID=A0A2S5B3P6_9BASI|nr:hypothetical protein BMF94_5677 [Rhodotorula taiwanensis]